MAESGARLPFVDDKPSIPMTLPSVLQKAGFDVCVAESVLRPVIFNQLTPIQRVDFLTSTSAKKAMVFFKPDP